MFDTISSDISASVLEVWKERRQGCGGISQMGLVFSRQYILS